MNDSDEITVNVFQFYSLWNSETLFGPGLISLINKQSVYWSHTYWFCGFVVWLKLLLSEEVDAETCLSSWVFFFSVLASCSFMFFRLKLKWFSDYEQRRVRTTCSSRQDDCFSWCLSSDWVSAADNLIKRWSVYGKVFHESVRISHLIRHFPHFITAECDSPILERRRLKGELQHNLK